MGRYVFKAKDLEPLRTWLDQPLARQVLEAAVPVKRYEPGRQLTEEAIELPVRIQSREEPGGVPLHAILRAVKAEAPTVVGLTVRGDKVFLKHGAKPKAAEREKALKLLRDPKKLTALSQPPVKPPPAKGEDLEKLLLNEGTPDAEWLRAFRRYAVANLIKPTKKVPK